jgi:signal transduction histidine kinase
MLKEKSHEQKATVGFTDSIYWLAFTYLNQTNQQEDKILEIDNPHVDWLNVYALDSAGGFQLLVETGDKLLFSSRPIRHRNFAIPLSYASGETRTILIKIDKRNSSLSFPTYLWNENNFYSKYFTQNLWYGLFFGIIVLCLFYALMAFIFLRKALYGWYFLLVFTSAASLFSLLGYSFQYVYPNVLDINGIFRAYLQGAFYVCMVKFTQQYLNLPYHQPLVNRLLNYMLIIIGLLALAIPFSLDFMIRNNLWIGPLTYAIYFTGFILFVFGAIRSYTRQRITVLIYFLAWGTLLVGYVIWISSSLGFIPAESLKVNPVLIGSSLETFIFSVGLTYQISKVYNERNQLSLAMARQQKDLLKAYVEGTEKERQRISRELHDDIGSRLGSLKRFISGNESHSVTLEKQIDILCQDVRSLSHQLAPTSLEMADFRQLINQLLEEVSQHKELKTDVQFYDVPKILSPEITHHLFRITQEIISNILKHAHATELDIQFFGYENEIVMTIEDNGQGFDVTSHASGIGLKNMKARAESLNGLIEINSTPGNGTTIMIKIPV